MAKARRSVAKSEFVEKHLATALERLELAAAAGQKAVAVRLRDGKTIVLVTHDQELAAKYATQVVKLRDGKVMEVGV